MAQSPSSRSQIAERGAVFFAYRPRVYDLGAEEEVGSIDDIQRFYMILRPEGSRRLRLLTVGRKRLPDVGENERVWGFVDLVGPAHAIEDALAGAAYSTRTRGARFQPAARPCGEGEYEIVLIGRGMRFAYQLTRPRHPGPVQRALNILPEASLVLSVKNPEASSPPGVGLGRREKAIYPQPLEREFRGRRFEVDDPRPFDIVGTEFVLVGGSEHPEEAYGLDIPEERAPGEREAARTFRVRDRKRLEPLRSGRWA